MFFQHRNSGIESRRSLSKSRVQFEDAARFSSSITDQSSIQPEENSTFSEISRNISKNASMETMKSNTNTSEEFFSPDASFEDKIIFQKNKTTEGETLNEQNTSKEVQNDIEAKKDVEMAVTQSPRARRTYKRE